MPNPSVRATGATAIANAASLNIVVPPGAVVGDLLVMYTAAGSTTIQPTPAGWDLQASGLAGATTCLGLIICTRTCIAGDAGSTVNVASPGTNRRIGVILAIKDVDPTVRVSAASTTMLMSASSTTTRPVPTLNSTGPAALPLLFVADRASGTVPPNDGLASDTWTLPGMYADGLFYSARTGSGLSVGDASLAIAWGDPVTGTTPVGGGNYVSHYINVRAGAGILVLRSGPVTYPQLDVREGSSWVRANVLGVGAAGVIAPVTVLDLAPTPAPPVPDLAFDFNDGVMPAAFVTHTGSAVNAAAAYAGAYGVRMTPDGSGIATMTISGAQFPSGNPWCGFKMRFRLNSAPGALNTYMNLFEIGNALTTAPKSQFTVFFDTGNLTADFNAGEEQIVAATPSVGGWHLIEVRVGFGATSYQAKIRYDGGPVITFTSPATKTPSTASVLWIHYPGTAVDYQMDIDDVALVTSASDPGFF